MGISTKQLEEEKAALQFTFDQLNMKIKKLEVETQNMRNNMNAVHGAIQQVDKLMNICLLYTSPSPRDGLLSRMPSSA